MSKLVDYLQVCSRIQKYFVQLAKLGLPVPGKVPNLAAHRRKYRNKYKNKVRYSYCTKVTCTDIYNSCIVQFIILLSPMVIFCLVKNSEPYI